MPKRILLKLSGEYLGGAQGQGFDQETVAGLTQQVQEVHAAGYEVAIVFGGGNFFRGAKAQPFAMDRVTGDMVGMLATLMNSLYLQESFKARGIQARTMTGLQAPQAAEPFNKAKAIAALEAGEILILGGGTGNPFFSTDTAAALRALEVQADLVLKGTKVDGVFDKDPAKHADAVKFDSLSYSEVLERDLKVMDQPAIALLRENGLPLGVVNLSAQRDLLDFLEGKPVGTRVHV